MKNTKKTIAGIMAFAMMLSLASCGDGKNDSNSGSSDAVNNSSQGDSSNQEGNNNPVTADELAQKSFKAIEIETEVSFRYIENISPLNDAKGEKLLVTGSNEDDETVMYITDRNFTNFTPVNYKIEADEKAETYYSAVSQKDGSIFIFVSITTHGDVEAPDYEDPDFDYENFDWDAYNEAAESTYKVVNIDSEGIVISENEVTGIDKYFEDENSFYIGSACSFGEGALMRLGSKDSGEDMLVTLGTDGVIGDKIEFEDDDIYNIYTNAMDKDGNFCFVTWGDDGNIIKKIDSATMAVSDDVIEIDSKKIDYINKIYTGSGDYDFYVSNSTSLYGIKADGTTEEVINWLDSDLNGDYVQNLIPVDNGEFIIYEQNWQANTNGFYRLTKRDASELENVQIITMVMEYTDQNITEKVNQFNKSNDKYRIKIDDYNKYYEWDEETRTSINSPEKQLQLDIAAGKNFDIVCMNGQSAFFTNLGKKGALTDLYELMGKDGTVAKDDIVPNVLEAGEIDGKLVSLSPTFSVNTFAAKKKFVDKENWTLDDLIETFNSLPDDMRLFRYSQAKSDIFQQFVITGGFVDYENAKCSFDSEECLQLLEFCNGLEDSEEPDYENMTDEEMNDYQMDIQLAIRNDKALLCEFSLYNLRDYARTKYGEFNEDMCLVGFPSKDGNGVNLSTNTSFAIMANSSNKDAAWSFISEFFTEDYQSGENIYEIPSLKSAFSKKLDDTMSKPYWIDEDGKKQEYDDTYYTGVDDEGIKIPPLSKEERDELEAYILSAKPKGWIYNEELFNIVAEESEAYFKGERSAQEALDLIQSRCSIILSEQF